MRRIAAAALCGTISLWLALPAAQRPDSQGPVSNELIVKFRPQAAQRNRELALSRHGARLLRHFQSVDVTHISFPAAQSLQAALGAFAADPDVEFVQPNYVRQTTQAPAALPNDPFWIANNLWGLKRIGADAAWAGYSTGSPSVVVGSIDTGVNYFHPDLSANIWTNPLEIPSNGLDDDHNGYVDDVHGINSLTHSGDPMDDHGHGTHTAGTMAGVGNNGIGVVGVTWTSKIVACKFLNAAGSGTDAGAIECFNYLVALRQRGVNIRVTNNSYGSARTGDIPVGLKAAIDAAGNAGIINVFGAGNSGTNNDVAPFDPASLPSPNSIAVAASDSDDTRAGFSNYGTSVHLAAPGTGIASTYGANYAYLSGTSMAAPHVAGAVALFAGLRPLDSPAQIKAALIGTVDPLPQWTGFVASGGRLNVFRALTMAAGAATQAEQTLLTTQVPAGEYRDGSGITYELGVKLRSDVAGQITALRYWKASLENGPHIGRVWTAAGQLLASVTFTNETAVGWQQQALATPVAIAAQTDYVVAVSTGANGYYVSSNGLATVVSNLHLQTSGPNGGRYGPLGSFPVNSSVGNYFRDVVFVPDTAPPVLQPAPVATSNLKLRLDLVGQLPTHTNLTSAAVADSQLLLPDQAGYIYRWDGSQLSTLLTPADFPAGIFPPGGESVLNVAANAQATRVYVMYSTFLAPVAIPVTPSPRLSDSWQILYEYTFNGTALSNPRAIRAFAVRSDSHTGGGLVVLGDGTVLAAFGDGGDAGEDGRTFAQDPTNHLSKIVRIDPLTGSTAVVALGLRNAQRLALYGSGASQRLDFVDLGGSVAEELNSVLVSELLSATPPNFGWGRDASATAREGTFYIDFAGAAVGVAPVPDPGFRQPVGQFGREGAALIAVSGPVSSSQSFTTMTSVFGDLPSGNVYAVTGALNQPGQVVFRVSLFDAQMQPVTLQALAGGRPDVRFFNFADGSAGLLLERTGQFFRLTQVQ